ncbi:Adenylyl-sulfate kinase [Termitomyces sp. Mn162]|nr:Adenylyl-sulfate kinase [Termitomyces sp. Mn162]
MDAGHYLCDFIYFCSLAEAKRTANPYERRRNSQVLFLHCPPVNQPLSTEKVTEAIQQIIVWVSKLFADSACVVVTAFISPYLVDRALARDLHVKSGIPFVEVFVDAPLHVVEARDPKGLYKKARTGEIKDFTGVSAPYEAPEDPEIHIKTDEMDIIESVRIITEYLLANNYIS